MVSSSATLHFLRDRVSSIQRGLPCELQGAAYLSLPTLGFRHIILYPAVYMDAGDPNSCLHACMTNTLPTKSSSSLIKKKCVLIRFYMYLKFSHLYSSSFKMQQPLGSQKFPFQHFLIKLLVSSKFTFTKSTLKVSF